MRRRAGYEEWRGATVHLAASVRAACESTALLFARFAATVGGLFKTARNGMFQSG